MSNSPLVSIIIPAYNAARFIDRCLDSLVAQTLHDIEVIVVDDGSTDDTPALLDGWAERDHRIRVVHQPNGGISVARNTALDMASAPFIGFVDSDDYVAPDMYETLYQMIQSTGADMAIGNAFIEPHDAPDEGTPMQHGDLKEGHIYTPHELLHHLIYHKSIGNYVWVSLYRSHLWADIRFPAGKWYEDIVVQHHLIDRATKGIVCTHKPLYHYIMHGTNFVSRFDPKHEQHYVCAMLDRLEFVQHSPLFSHRERAQLQTAIVKDTLRPCRLIYWHADSRHYRPWLKEVYQAQSRALLIPFPPLFRHIYLLERMVIALNYRWIQIKYKS